MFRRGSSRAVSPKKDDQTLSAAANYAMTLLHLNRFKEAKSVLHKTIPGARRVLGESAELTLKMRWNYARTLIATPGATLADQREAVATLEDTERIARRVLGGTHPVTTVIEKNLKEARSILAAFDAP